MNKQECDILTNLYIEPFAGQRLLSEKSGHSLGVVNKSLRSLQEQGYLKAEMELTKKAKDEFKEKSPKNAIILAAGFGMRMVPINLETPKALLEVHGEVLIERLIRQLHEVGIEDITVVVGFMKEQFEYLIDEFHVKLIVNMDYAVRNNLHTLFLASSKLSDTYIVPCDIWCETNPFRKQELYSWYMVNDLIDNDSSVRVNRRMELVTVPKMQGGNTMIGIAYLVEETSRIIKERLVQMDEMPAYHNAFWEETLFENGRMIVQARVVHTDEAEEINTYEQLREIDADSNHLRSDAIDTIAKALQVNVCEITDIQVLKKGMTNRSFLFQCQDKRYIMRIPGEGTEQLINRKNEYAVYQVIKDKDISDEIIFIDPKSGYKITRFLENARVCDPDEPADLKLCMDRLRAFHKMNLQVPHTFPIFETIDFYERLWPTGESIYKDYKRTKENVFSMAPYIEKHTEHMCLTHIDAVPDNFLILPDGKVRLIDWEYAGMQDPHVDIAMFCIYSLYEKDQVDRLIDIYFENRCPKEFRLKIYCYIAACGLLWSNWCEYKRSLGVEFGEYSLRQYRYAKEYYELFRQETEGK